MKVSTDLDAVIVSKSRKGGAGTAAWRWHLILRSSGYPSFFLDEQSLEKSSREIFQFSDFVIKALNNICLKLTNLTGHTPLGPFSFDYFKSSADRWFEENKSNSKMLVNIHWINSGFMSLKGMKRVSKRHVSLWTVHDAWLIHGLAHYSIPAISDRFNRHFIYRTIDRLNQRRKRELLTLIDGIIAPSHWLREQFISFGYPAEKIRVIPNPIPHDVFFPLERNKIKKEYLKSVGEEEALLIGFVSASKLSDSRKGFDLIEQALINIGSNRLSNVILLIAGPEFVQSTIDPRIKVLHFGNLTNGEELNNFYNICDLLVVPSRIDNLPQSATEAQSSGCPVLISNVGGCSETIIDGKTGWLFNGCSSDLTKRLLFLLENRHLLLDARLSSAKFARTKWESTRLINEYKSFERLIRSKS